MSAPPRRSRLPVSAGQLALWPLAEEGRTPSTPGSGAGEVGTETDEDETTSPRRQRTPSFVVEVPLRVGPAEERVLQARLEAARALYNACLGEARRRWLLVRQSRAYQHARTLPRHTPERTDAFKAAKAVCGFTEAALQVYAKNGRHASHWIEAHLDAPVAQKLATRAYRAVMQVAVGNAKRVRFKGRHQLDTVEGKSNETGLVWRSDRVVWRG